MGTASTKLKRKNPQSAVLQPPPGPEDITSTTPSPIAAGDIANPQQEMEYFYECYLRACESVGSTDSLGSFLRQKYAIVTSRHIRGNNTNNITTDTLGTEFISTVQNTLTIIRSEMHITNKRFVSIPSMETLPPRPSGCTSTTSSYVVNGIYYHVWSVPDGVWLSRMEPRGCRLLLQ
eukprot:PhF_6_TR40521/c0_g2_i1/m.60684